MFDILLTIIIYVCIRTCVKAIEVIRLMGAEQKIGRFGTKCNMCGDFRITQELDDVFPTCKTCAHIIIPKRTLAETVQQLPPWDGRM